MKVGSSKALIDIFRFAWNTRALMRGNRVAAFYAVNLVYFVIHVLLLFGRS